jgi:hypothetical protein
MICYPTNKAKCGLLFHYRRDRRDNLKIALRSLFSPLFFASLKSIIIVIVSFPNPIPRHRNPKQPGAELNWRQGRIVIVEIIKTIESQPQMHQRDYINQRAPVHRSAATGGMFT